MRADSCTTDCPPDNCASAFQRVVPFPTINFGTKISWQLRPGFTAPEPYTFQLQVGRTQLNTADDWEDVGTEVVDTYYAYDDEKRVYGKAQWTAYRVKMTDGNGDVYYSRPVGADGYLSQFNYTRMQAMIRTWSMRVAAPVNADAIPIYVLKRRIHGTPCPDCVDYQLGASTDDNCTTCFGTAITGGYFTPDLCRFAEPRPNNRRVKVDEQLQRGTVDDQVMTIATLADLYLQQNDVIVMKNTDERHYVHGVQDTVLVAGVPVFCQVELRLAPYSDVIYSFQIEDQIS